MEFFTAILHEAFLKAGVAPPAARLLHVEVRPARVEDLLQHPQALPQQNASVVAFQDGPLRLRRACLRFFGELTPLGNILQRHLVHKPVWASLEQEYGGPATTNEPTAAEMALHIASEIRRLGQLCVHCPPVSETEMMSMLRRLPLGQVPAFLAGALPEARHQGVIADGDMFVTDLAKDIYAPCLGCVNPAAQPVCVKEVVLDEKAAELTLPLALQLAKRTYGTLAASLTHIARAHAGAEYVPALERLNNDLSQMHARLHAACQTPLPNHLACVTVQQMKFHATDSNRSMSELRSRMLSLSPAAAAAAASTEIARLENTTRQLLKRFVEQRWRPVWLVLESMTAALSVAADLVATLDNKTPLVGRARSLRGQIDKLLEECGTEADAVHIVDVGIIATDMIICHVLSRTAAEERLRRYDGEDLEIIMFDQRNAAFVDRCNDSLQEIGRETVDRVHPLRLLTLEQLQNALHQLAEDILTQCVRLTGFNALHGETASDLHASVKELKETKEIALQLNSIVGSLRSYYRAHPQYMAALMAATSSLKSQAQSDLKARQLVPHTHFGLPCSDVFVADPVMGAVRSLGFQSTWVQELQRNVCYQVPVDVGAAEKLFSAAVLLIAQASPASLQVFQVPQPLVHLDSQLVQHCAYAELPAARDYYTHSAEEEAAAAAAEHKGDVAMRVQEEEDDDGNVVIQEEKQQEEEEEDEYFQQPKVRKAARSLAQSLRAAAAGQTTTTTGKRQRSRTGTRSDRPQKRTRTVETDNEDSS